MTSERRLRDFENNPGCMPKAEECISYHLPAFRLDGKCLVWFGAAANHCAIYGVLGDRKDELKDYDISKGTIRFQADKAMPSALVLKLVKARILENVGRSNKAPPANQTQPKTSVKSNRSALPHRRPAYFSESRFSCAVVAVFRCSAV
jgi:uncharacterized protein YdhG (YjbR/CyaY superfamily)